MEFENVEEMDSEGVSVCVTRFVNVSVKEASNVEVHVEVLSDVNVAVLEPVCLVWVSVNVTVSVHVAE